MKNFKNQPNATATRMSLLMVLLFPLFLGACHTVEGVGTDIKETGKALENAAESSRDSCPPSNPPCRRTPTHGSKSGKVQKI